MHTCPVCASEFRDGDGGYLEWGLVCGGCSRDYDAVPTHYPEPSSSVGKLVAMNAVGLGLGMVTGVGFTYGGKNEPPPIPEPERQKMFRALVAERLQREGPRRLPRVRLRRGAVELGAFTVEQLSQRWTEGGVLPTDQYWYEGMSDWAVVTEFQPPPDRTTDVAAKAADPTRW